MKKYLKENLTAIAIGFAIGLLFAMIITMVEDVIIKIALISSH